VLGPEKGKKLGSGLSYAQMREVEQGLYCAWSELIFILTFGGLHVKNGEQSGEWVLN
jgi:hypothetical protein